MKTQYPLDIVIACDGLPFHGNTIKESSLGGSETSALMAAVALKRKGNSVVVFSNCGDKAGTYDGVHYRDFSGFPIYASNVPHDVLIVQRRPDLFTGNYNSKINILWQHDLSVLRGVKTFRSSAWNVDSCFVMSEFQRQQSMEVNGLPEEYYWITRNGIDLELFKGKELPREPKKLIYAARPERGLDILLCDILPKLLEKDPEIKLFIAGYKHDVPQLQDFYNGLKKEAAKYPKNVTWLSPLPKKKLYEHYKTSALYTYPSGFEEISCCTGDTLVDLPRDYVKYPEGIPIGYLVGKSNFPVYCYDNENEKITLGTVKWVARTKKQAEVWKLTLDDGNVLRATPEHKIMLRDGSYKELKDLKPGESLMPLYKKATVLVNLNNGKWENEHRLAGMWKEGRELNGHEEHVHHINKNMLDNSPDNLEVLSRFEHFSKTFKGIERSPKCYEAGAKATRRRFANMNEEEKKELSKYNSKIAKEFWDSMNSEEREKFIKERARKGDNPKNRKLRSEGAKKFWDSMSSEEYAVFVANRTEKIKEAWRKKSPEELKGIRRKGAEGYKRFWQSMTEEEKRLFIESRNEKTAESLDKKRRASYSNHKVISVEFDSYEDVYDMEVEKYHNFVANGIVIHNCITAMETQACGLPFIGRDVAALKETLHPDAGVLLSGFDSARNPEFQRQFTETVLNLLNNKEEIGRMSKAGKKHSKALDWDGVADEWIDKFYNIFESNTANKFTLAKHFTFHSDIVTAKKLLNKIENPREKELLEKELKHWDINFEKENETNINAMSDNGVEQYLADIGGIEVLKKITKQKTEPHWPMLDSWLKEHPEVKTFLDFGCFTGRYAIPLANANKDYKVTGIDINKKTLDIAREVMKDVGEYNNCKFIQGTYKTIKLEEKVDCILLFDIIEHLPDLEEALPILESYVKEGGWILIVTPHGPMEAESFGRFDKRMHVHEFEKQDLKDLFGKKKNFNIVFVPLNSRSKIDGSCFAKVVVSYQKDKIPVGRINYDRKMLCQAPKQTISACMIAKNEEGALHRCLKSIHPYVDEIIIADTGSTDSTIEIAKQYEAKIVKGSNPNKYGFETPRNESIKDTVGDWILWIDGDEEFLGGHNLGKYLRSNIFKGYSVRQHHFSASPPNAFKPDLPVRVFRNKRNVKFYGCLAEGSKISILDSNNGLSLKNIEKIEVGDKVLTHDRTFKKVEKLWVYPFDGELIELEAEQGEYGKSTTKLHLTKGHKLTLCYSSTLKMKEARDAQLGDFVHYPVPEQQRKYFSDPRGILNKLINIKNIFYKGFVYDLKVESNHSYVANGISVSNCIHEHPETGLNEGVGLSTILGDIDIAHAGYYTEDIRRNRFQRNLPLLKMDREKYPDRLLGKFFLLRDLVHISRYNMEKTRGKITPEIIDWCRQAVDMYQKEFLGKSLIMGNEALQYYSDANCILGQGVEVAWEIDISKQQANLGRATSYKARFANDEDAKKFFSHIIELGIKPFMSKYY